jgi:RNA polymerase sigma-70 factor (ECF subfamily)
MSGVLAEWTDQRLLEATADGDEEAFVEIYRRHHPRVFRFALRMTGSPDAAHDVTQVCFTALLEAPRRYRGLQARLDTYLCAAARNQSLKRLRRVRREVQRELEDRPPDRASGPLGLLLAEEEARLVRQAVLALAPLHREVVILVEYEGMALSEVAEVVGADVGTVKVRLHRARRKLRRALEPYVSVSTAGVVSADVRKS